MLIGMTLHYDGRLTIKFSFGEITFWKEYSNLVE